MGERHEQRVERAPPVGHRERLAWHAEHAPRGVIGGDDEQPAVGEQRPPRTLAQRVNARSGWSAALGDQRRANGHRSRTSSISSSNGMSSAHIRRDADDRAGRVAGPRAPHEVPARQQAVAQRAAERIAGAETAHHLDRDTARPARASRRRWRRARRRLPSSRSPPRGRGRAGASAARSGSDAPTATSHSARLPIAIVTWSSTRSISAVAARRRRARTAAASRGRARCACGGHATSAGRGSSCGSAPRDRHDVGNHRIGTVRDDVEVDVGARDVHVGRLRLAVEDDARFVGVLQLGERERRPQVGVDADEARVDAERVARARLRT